MAAPPKIIFDTDLGADADDLGALAMLLNLSARGETELLGIMSWSNERYAIPAIDAVTRWYGRGEVPIAVRQVGSWQAKWHYSRPLAERLGGRRTAADVPGTTELYRRILAEQPDGSVTIVAVGPLANILNLLKSPADAISPLGGRDLVHRKVSRFVIMGGHFPQGRGEWNFNGEMPGVTRAVLAQIALPVVFSGYEVGDAIRTGRILNRIDEATPLRIGYRHFSEHAPWMKERFRGEILDNASFDQTAVLYAVRGGVGDWWDEVKGGRVEVEENGDNRWVPGPVTNHSYLRLRGDPERVARVIEKMMLGDF
jgi:inosine-uridine nucleoside N-ribohydrolase